jgi:acetamidase/formamidase
MSALQPGVGPIRSDTYLPAEPSAVFWGELPCATDSPVLTIDSGTEVTVDTISHEGILDDQGRDPRRFFAQFGDFEVLDDAIALAASPRDRGDRGPHVVTGPIRVEGALPGDLLKITVVETLQRVPYGVISNRHGRGALPTGEIEPFSVFASSDGDHGSLPTAGRSVRFPLRPFLGVMGVAVSGNQRPNSIPPGPHGGNIDINLLTEGSSLYLPIQVAGALAYVGDPHFAQGDGEVALTAMEASLRATLRFEVVPHSASVDMFGQLVGPLAETSDFLVPTGMNEDLDVAVQDCVRAAIALLQSRYGLDQSHAYAYLSAATDFNISQVVDLVKGVHARIRKSDFE